jgi:hypothetical protein
MSLGQIIWLTVSAMLFSDRSVLIETKTQEVIHAISWQNRVGNERFKTHSVTRLVRVE